MSIAIRRRYSSHGIEILLLCLTTLWSVAVPGGCSGSEPVCAGGIRISLFEDAVPVTQVRIAVGPNPYSDTADTGPSFLAAGMIFLLDYDPDGDRLWIDVWPHESDGDPADAIRINIPPPFPQVCGSTRVLIQIDIATGELHRIPVSAYGDESPVMTETRWLTEEEVRAAGGRIYPAGE